MFFRTKRARVDPICGMRLLSEQDGLTYTYIGQEYHFCSKACYELFLRSPEYYITLLAHDDRGHCGVRFPSRGLAQAT